MDLYWCNMISFRGSEYNSTICTEPRSDTAMLLKKTLRMVIFRGVIEYDNG
jgi:hypothetical protein